jgi:NAD(P)H-quinone oxidoreductase subunit 5
MGFMLLECGLGLYSLAMLHLVAHSLYKAHAFLSSGSGVDSFRAPTIEYANHNTQLWKYLLAFVFALFLTVGIGMAFGISVAQQPVLLAVGAVIAIAMTQLLIQASSIQSNWTFISRALGLTVVVCIAYFALHHLFELALAGSVLPVQDSNGLFQKTLIAAIIIVFMALLFLQQALKSRQSQQFENVYVHLYNGLYIDVYITRMLQRIWPAPLANVNSNGG